MAQWALQFTPQVTLEKQRDVLLMEVYASLRLWGGIDSLLARLKNDWRAFGWQSPDCISMASASTARSAHWQVMHAIDLPEPPEIFSGISLSQLSIDVVEEAHPHLETFARMGIRTIGQLEKLPRAGVSRRFGKSLLYALDAAHGRIADPRIWITPADVFQARLELPARADHTALILLGAHRLLNELAGWLYARRAGIRSLELMLIHDSPPHTSMSIGLASLTRYADRIERVLNEKFSRVQLPRPVYEIELRAAQVEPLPESTTDFLGGPHDDHDSLSQLVERLQARLGSGQVRRLHLLDDHRPEAAMCSTPIADTSERSHVPHWPDASAASHRPLWLLSPPLPLAVQDQRPSYRGPIRLLSGPERIEAGWWEDNQNDVMRRDYFVAASGDESLLWVFRTPEHRWFLHGLFA